MRRGCEVRGEIFENISKDISSCYSKTSWCWWICEEWLWSEGEDGEIVLSVVTQCQRTQLVVMITFFFVFMFCAMNAVVVVNIWLFCTSVLMKSSTGLSEIGCSWKAPDLASWTGTRETRRKNSIIWKPYGLVNPLVLQYQNLFLWLEKLCQQRIDFADDWKSQAKLIMQSEPSS